METSRSVGDLAERMDSDVIFLLGAGASCPFGLPTSNGFFEQFITSGFPNVLYGSISPFRRTEKYNPEEALLYHCLRAKYINYNPTHQAQTYDVEEIYSMLERLNRMLKESNPDILALYSLIYEHRASSDIEFSTFKSSYARLTQDKGFVRSLQEIIRKTLKWLDDGIDNVFGGVEGEKDAIWHTWSSILEDSFEKRQTLPIFTTNYDSVFEVMRTRQEFSKAYSFIDGVEPSGNNSREYYFGLENYIKQSDGGVSLKKLFYFKLHGSLTWVIKKDGTIWVKPDESPPRERDGVRCIIPPSLTKQRDIANELKPFGGMLEALKVSLRRAKVCFVIGFAFRDDVIRNIFNEALKENTKLHIEAIIPQPAESKIGELKPSNRVRRIASMFGEPEAEEAIRTSLEKYLG